MKSPAFLLLGLLLVLAACPASGKIAEENSQDTVRVCILDGKDEIRLELKGRYRILALDSGRVLMEGPYLRTNVRGTRQGLVIGSRDIKVLGVKVKVSKDSNIYINSRRFRGDVDIIRKENLALMVINHIGLENYLYGVLYHEVSHRWPMEVLKAQAIAARTFAVYQAKQNRLQPYDLRSDIYSQMYGGRTSEKWSTNRAVNLTRGKVLIYNKEIFPPYYHATCAGYTEDASNLWNIDSPVLKGVRCDFCKNSRHYKWKKEIPLPELENKLKYSGYDVGRIASVGILSRNRSGRVDKLEIKDESGTTVIMTGKDFRQALGPNEVRSTNFEVGLKKNRLALQGYGWGHGVGMCQWGAFGMSREGKKAEEILKFYYPGAEITTLDTVKNKL